MLIDSFLSSLPGPFIARAPLVAALIRLKLWHGPADPLLLPLLRIVAVSVDLSPVSSRRCTRC